MIERIAIQNFKSLKTLDLKLGRLNLFIGTNASGKSNFFDALRVLQGIGYGFTIHEILDGKPKSAASEVWEPIRGGSAKATFTGAADADDISFHVWGRLAGDAGQEWEYLVCFSARDGRLRQEWLSAGRIIYDSEPAGNAAEDPAFHVRFHGGRKIWQPHLGLEKSRPVLGHLARGGNGKWSKGHAELAQRITHDLANMQRIDPSPIFLRGYSQAQTIQRMGERGENFAALIRAICADEKAKKAYVSWLKELRPAEVEDVGTLQGAVGEPLFMLKEGGQEFPAPVLSDGTLRFAAITAAFFQPDMPGILTIEEVENGIHASRLRLLVEMLRNRAKAGQTQIMATTHSPIVLAWLKKEEYATTFFCKRDETTGESHICSLPKVPHFEDTVQKQPISDLFAEGWLEDAL